MALEGLRDALLQAGQDYFKANRQNQLIASEREREDALYQKRLADQIESENRAERRQISAEDRATKRQVEAETRSIDNEVKRLEKLSPIIAGNTLRTALAEATGDPSWADRAKRTDDEVKASHNVEKNNKLYRDVLAQKQAELNAATATLEGRQALEEKVNAKAVTSVTGALRMTDDTIRSVTERLGQLDEGKKKEIMDLYSKVQDSAIEEVLGDKTLAERNAFFKERKIPSNASKAEIAMGLGLTLDINNRMKGAVEGVKSKDGKQAALLAELQSAFAQRSHLVKQATDLKVDFGSLYGTPASGGKGYLSNGGAASTEGEDQPQPNAEVPRTAAGTPTPEALMKAVGSRNASAPKNPPSGVGEPANPLESPSPQPSPQGSSYLSAAGQFIKDNPAAAGGAALTATPYLVAAAPSVVNAASQAAGAISNVPAYLRGALEAGRLSDLRGAAEATGRLGGSQMAGMTTRAMGKAGLAALTIDLGNRFVPSALNFLGATNTKEVYGDRTPQVSELVGDAYLASREQAPARRFNDWYADRYQVIARANVPDEVKQQEMAKLRSAREQWFSQGKSWDTPLNAEPPPGRLEDYPRVKEFFDSMNRPPVPEFRAVR